MNMSKTLHKFAPAFAFSALAFSASALMAELPSSPLSEEYTVTGSETIHGEWWNTYEVASGGVLNILGDYAQLQVNYAFNYSPTFSGEGIVNIGSGAEYGRMIVTSAAEFGDNWNNIINFTGTINVGERGDFSISGTYPSHYGTIFYVGTLNVNGTVSVMSATSGNVSYFGIKNLSIGANGMLSSEIDLRTADGGVYDIYGNGLSAPRIRAGTGTSALNLRAQNVLANLATIDFESNKDSALKINAEASNSLNALTFYSNSALELSIAEGQTFLIKSLKVRGDGGENLSIAFYNYESGSFLIGNSDVSIEDNRIYLPSNDVYIDLIAYGAGGEILSGAWSLEWNGEANALMFAVPEPAGFALAFGALAAAFAAARRRR